MQVFNGFVRPPSFMVLPPHLLRLLPLVNNTYRFCWIDPAKTLHVMRNAGYSYPAVDLSTSFNHTPIDMCKSCAAVVPSVE